MESQLAQIQLTKRNARQTIEQPKADLSIQQPRAEIKMRTTPSKLTIDQTKAFEDMNLMNISKRIQRFAQEGRNGALQGMERRAQQGKELMKIENEGDPLVSQAVTNGHDSMKSLGIKFIPSTFAVKTNYQPAEVNIDVKTNNPIVEAKKNEPIVQYEPGSIETSIKQHANLEINFVNLFSETV